MGLVSFLLTSSLLYSVRFVSGRWETGLDGDLYGEIPRPTNEPLLYRDEIKHGAVLMNTRLGYHRNVTSRRNLSLSARQFNCEPGYVLTCPLTKDLPCCPQQYPICCDIPGSETCCRTGSFCAGVRNCCPNGEVGCTSPEGCCPGGTTCCGIWCCNQGSECRNQECVNLAQSSLSIASLASVSSKSLESVLSKSSESAAATQNAYGNGGGNNTAALVGGVVGGVLAVAILGLIGILLWKRNRASSIPPPAAPPAAPSSAQRPLFGQQPSSLPITPASQTFSTYSNYTSNPSVNAPQAAWHPQQLAPVTLPGAAGPTAGQSAPTPLQSPSPGYSVNTWIDRNPTNHQGPYGGYASQSQTHSFVSH